jgi:simple sugar transport system permease protein
MDATTIAQLLAVAIAFSAPLVYAAMGELISERAGVINIQLEGMMLVGAFSGVWAAMQTGSMTAGFLGGAVAGLMLATLHALLCFVFRAEQVVSGIVLNIFALGLTTYAMKPIFGPSAAVAADTLEKIAIPGLAEIPILGPALFDQNIMVYLAFVAVVAVWWFLKRTTAGLALQAAGEAPSAAISMGINVMRIRWLAVLTCGALAGIGGAQLTLAGLGAFTQNVTAGRGFVALAAVVFGRWMPGTTLVAVMLFTFTEAIQVRAQLLGISVPYQFLVMAPYAVTIIAIAFMKRGRAPASLGVALSH